MLKGLRGQIKEFADKLERKAKEPIPADLKSEGHLHVTLHKATNLKAMDSNGLSDPYCKVRRMKLPAAPELATA